MKAIKKWTVKDKKVPLTILKAVFGEGETGPNSIVQLGEALQAKDRKIKGVRKNVALGDKIIDAMAWEARKGRGPWQTARYTYAKGEMDRLYKLKGKEWNFNQYYRETRNLLNTLVKLMKVIKKFQKLINEEDKNLLKKLLLLKWKV